MENIKLNEKQWETIFTQQFISQDYSIQKNIINKISDLSKDPHKNHIAKAFTTFVKNFKFIENNYMSNTIMELKKEFYEKMLETKEQKSKIKI